jgi:hypothetical protein
LYLFWVNNYSLNLIPHLNHHIVDVLATNKRKIAVSQKSLMAVVSILWVEVFFGEQFFDSKEENFGLTLFYGDVIKQNRPQVRPVFILFYNTAYFDSMPNP